MSAIKNVILVGATGNLGSSILKALQNDPNLIVSVLTREGSATFNNPPHGVKLLAADYSSPSSLVEAFKGQDAVVSTVGALALSEQIKFIDAAIEAGVQRFIPSEFGLNPLAKKCATLAIFKNKTTITKYLQEAEGKIAWTAVVNGAFLDWGLKVGILGFNVAEKKAIFYDGGSRPFSTTVLADVGRAIVGVLSHPEETENRFVYVHSAVAKQSEILAVYEKLTGSKWEVEEKDTAELEKTTNAQLAVGNYSNIRTLIYRGLFGEGYGGELKEVDNDLLGIKLLDQAGIEEVIKGTL